MSEINYVMRGLWQEVYKGNDIEYIQIRSDVDDALTVATANTIEVDATGKKTRRRRKCFL